MSAVPTHLFMSICITVLIIRVPAMLVLCLFLEQARSPFCPSAFALGILSPVVCTPASFSSVRSQLRCQILREVAADLLAEVDASPMLPHCCFIVFAALNTEIHYIFVMYL